MMSAVPHALQSGQKIDAKRIEVPQELFKIFIGGIPQGIYKRVDASSPMVFSPTHQ